MRGVGIGEALRGDAGQFGPAHAQALVVTVAIFSEQKETAVRFLEQTATYCNSLQHERFFNRL